MSSEELIYYRERAIVERQRATESTNPYVIEIHNKLADLYERLVEHEARPKPTLQIVTGEAAAA